jgi:hypothetical protein
MKVCVWVLLWASTACAWIAFEGSHLRANGQGPTPALPMVSAAPVPLYPPVARSTNTQGVIHVKIQTDGHKVIEAHAEETNKLLSTAAEENAKKWEFSAHTSVSFTITYRYKLADECQPNNPTVTLHLPTEVEVCQHTFRLTQY